MKKLIISTFIIVCVSTSSMTEEKNCESNLSKLNPTCNFIGRSVDKMKDFSSKNKTIDQSLNNIKKKLP